MSKKSVALVTSAAPNGAAAVVGAEAVVVLAPVAVREHGVRDGELLEALLGRLVARVAVGVPLERELAVRRLDLDVDGLALDGERRRSSREAAGTLSLLARRPTVAGPSSGRSAALPLRRRLRAGPVETETIAGRSSFSPMR